MPKTTLKHELTIHALPTKLWSILTCSESTQQFLFDADLVSEWTEGSEVRSGTTNGLQGRILQVVPGVLLRFELHLSELSAEPVQFQFEIVPGEDGIQLKLLQEVCLHDGVTSRPVSEHTALMMQKIKWLAEYS